MRCPLCGLEFEETAMACHSSCMFNESCGIICCPNCGYQMPDARKSRLAEGLRLALARRSRRNGYYRESVRPLSMMQPGQSGTIVAIQSENESRVERLHIMGVMPDAQVTLTQKRPAYVLRVGFTELSVELEIADDILVEVTAAI